MMVIRTKERADTERLGKLKPANKQYNNNKERSWILDDATELS